MPRIKSQRTYVGARIPQNLLSSLDERAKAQGKDRTEVLVEAIEAFLGEGASRTSHPPDTRPPAMDAILERIARLESALIKSERPPNAPSNTQSQEPAPIPSHPIRTSTADVHRSELARTGGTSTRIEAILQTLSFADRKHQLDELARDYQKFGESSERFAADARRARFTGNGQSAALSEQSAKVASDRRNVIGEILQSQSAPLAPLSTTNRSDPYFEEVRSALIAEIDRILA